MKKQKTLLLILMLLMAVASTATVYAQTGGDYDLSWWTVDGGGGQLSGDGYTLTGTIGQPDAGNLGNLSGDDYTLSGGFWSHFSEWLLDFIEIYLPLIAR